MEGPQRPNGKSLRWALGWGVGAPQPNANEKSVFCPNPTQPNGIFLKAPPTQRNFEQNLQPCINAQTVFFRNLPYVRLEALENARVTLRTFVYIM